MFFVSFFVLLFKFLITNQINKKTQYTSNYGVVTAVASGNGTIPMEQEQCDDGTSCCKSKTVSTNLEAILNPVRYTRTASLSLSPFPSPLQIWCDESFLLFNDVFYDSFIFIVFRDKVAIGTGRYKSGYDDTALANR